MAAAISGTNTACVRSKAPPSTVLPNSSIIVKPTPGLSRDPGNLGKILSNATEQLNTTRIYDPAYVSIPYPNGDVPRDRGVCSDVIVRAFRAGGLDLQKTVHEDMRAHFSSYPRIWGLKRPDTNIDHRRVANLMTYFKRKGQSLPVTRNSGDYKSGDVVAWELPGGRLHIGLVSTSAAPVTQQTRIIHNIGAGARQEDVLFAWKIIGHYRVFR